MDLLKNIKKIFPERMKRALQNVIHGENKLKKLDTETVFTNIYRKNSWGDDYSISGTGSNPEQTKVIKQKIQQLLIELEVKSMLDVPCGDFNWMKDINLSNIDYIGGDIVGDIIKANKKYETENIRFNTLNLIKDDLPTSDLIIIRDCLVHFSFNDIFLTLKNICQGNSIYLLTTIFPAHTNNIDIFTGQWRPLNLMKPPFTFPDPIQILNEECTEENGQYTDKALGLWRISDIKHSLDI